MIKFELGKKLIAIALVIGAFVVVFPLIFVLLTSFAPSDYRPSSSLLPASLSWSNYFKAWSQADFALGFANSTLVAIAVTALQIMTSALAGYALARLEFWGKNAMLLLVIATLIIPFQLLVIPIFWILKFGHLINTYGALILPTAANGFGIFLLRQYIQTIPIELEEAAMLDGANRFQVLVQVILPLCRPALATLFLFTFIGEWNDLFKPLIFTSKPELRTVQIILAGFQELYTADWSLLMAAVVIATLPIILLFAIAQKQLLRGVATTGLKG